jgi:mannan endo-1,4-beta-mannosidase
MRFSVKKAVAAVTAAVMITGCSTGGGETADVSTEETTTTTTTATVTTAEKTAVDAGLSNPNATREANILYQYIKDMFGNHIIAGVQESTWMGTPEYEMNYCLETTGKLPAIRGFDFINEDYDGVTERSIKWWEDGGIVSICWHWGVPPTGIGYESSQSNGDMDTNPNWWTDLYDKETELGKGFYAKLDLAAASLAKLQDAGVPVLWRPFHELDGGWFWWGMGGSENFNNLWRFMYDYYTNEKGLNNLIWVLGYSHDVKGAGDEDPTATWYPGREYVDVAGADDYPNSPSPLKNAYEKVQRKIGHDETIPMAMHEIGILPEVSQLTELHGQEYPADWVWFLVWHTEWLTEHNSKEHLSAVFNDEYVITRDELPDFKNM